MSKILKISQFYANLPSSKLTTIFSGVRILMGFDPTLCNVMWIAQIAMFESASLSKASIWKINMWCFLKKKDAIPQQHDLHYHSLVFHCRSTIHQNRPQTCPRRPSPKRTRHSSGRQPNSPSQRSFRCSELKTHIQPRIFYFYPETLNSGLSVSISSKLKFFFSILGLKIFWSFGLKM